MNEKILIVDDDPSFNKMLSSLLLRNDYEVASVYSARSALEHLQKQPVDLVLTDFKLPDFDGLELMQKIKAGEHSPAMILITNYSDLRTAVKSIQVGAFEFVTKPVIPDQLLITVKAALKQLPSPTTPAASARTGTLPTDSNYVVGQSPKNQALWEHISLVAPTKMSVLLVGESGTGKEHVARMIHESSKRASKPFATVDCGSLSRELASSELFGHTKGAFTGASEDKRGLFEAADGGTLFLDEVGNLPYEVQVLLLRALQERKIRRLGTQKDIPVDVRLVAATNEDMSRAVSNKSFRLDLYHRVNEFEIKLPALRERMEDLDAYLGFFLEEANLELEKAVSGFSEEVVEIFRGYAWPGNLRELRNIVRRATLLCMESKITPMHIPDVLRAEAVSAATQQVVREETYDLKGLQEQQEKEAILKVLEEVRYNKTNAAKLLNIDRSTLYYKLSKYDIKA